MRTAVACLVLAAAIATPGIVVASTAGGHPAEFNVTQAFGGTGSPAAGGVPLVMHDIGSGERPPPIDPGLRPAARALTRAFARTGVTFVAFPAGRGTAVLFASRSPATQGCPTTIVLETLHAPPFGTPPCPTRGVGLARGLKISYTPASLSPTIELALGKLH